MAATDSDPVALQHFELTPEPVPAEVLGGASLEVWALQLSGGTVREVLTTDPAQVTTREYVFAVPLDVMGNLARKTHRGVREAARHHFVAPLAWGSLRQ
jgi:hypothetical protein